VYDFVAYINRRTQEFQCTLDDLDRTVDSGAKTPGIGE
jgi:hypothetical protein